MSGNFRGASTLSKYFLVNFFFLLIGQCNSTQYWDLDFLMCLNKIKENQTCSQTYQCFEPMNCTEYNMCQCGPFEYHDFPTLTCLPQQSYLGNCSVDLNCRVDKYLECVNGLCVCIPQYPHWSNGYDKCIIPKIYNEFCYETLDCNSGLNLICHLTGQNCSCPTKVSNSYCDCIRELNNEYYWNGTSCVNCKGYNQTCTATYMCETMTEGTICSGGKCKCPTLQYYNFIDGKCENQINYNLPCSQTDACRSDLGLVCQIGICLCDPAIQFWSGTTCVDLYTYYKGKCTSDSQCFHSLNLVCGGTMCSCPSIVPVGNCDCPPRVLYNEWFWNGTMCVPAGYHGVSCTYDNQCQTLANLTCRSGICDCRSGLVWSEEKYECVSCDPGFKNSFIVINISSHMFFRMGKSRNLLFHCCSVYVYYLL